MVSEAANTALQAQAPMNETNKSLTNAHAVKDSFLEEIENLVRSEHSDPFQILGPHWEDRRGGTVLAIRAVHPGAVEVAVVSGATGGTQAAVKIHPEGLFEAVVPAGTLQASV